MKYLKLIFAAPLLALYINACTPAESKKSIPSLQDPIAVKVMALEKQETAGVIVVAGQFTTDDETSLSFKTGGVISNIKVKEGDYVRKGQLLATLDLTEIRSLVNQASLGLEKAKRDLKRVENLYNDSVATLEQLQNARTGYELAEQQYRTAQFNLQYSEIRAVSDGYILKKHVNSGQVVGPGQVILRTNGAGKSQWLFKAQLSDKEWAQVAVNDKAAIKTDISEEIVLHAKLVRKSEGADPVTGSFTVDFTVEPTKGIQLASGLFGTATVSPTKKSSSWKIPHEALLDGNGNQGFVFVTNDKQTASKIPVQVGTLTNEFVNITQGLENQNFLITSGSAYLIDGSKIVISN